MSDEQWNAGWNRQASSNPGSDSYIAGQLARQFADAQRAQNEAAWRPVSVPDAAPASNVGLPGPVFGGGGGFGGALPAAANPAGLGKLAFIGAVGAVLYALDMLGSTLVAAVVAAFVAIPAALVGGLVLTLLQNLPGTAGATRFGLAWRISYSGMCRYMVTGFIAYSLLLKTGQQLPIQHLEMWGNRTLHSPAGLVGYVLTAFALAQIPAVIAYATSIVPRVGGYGGSSGFLKACGVGVVSVSAAWAVVSGWALTTGQVRF